jgi:hypothetical protein
MNLYDKHKEENLGNVGKKTVGGTHVNVPNPQTQAGQSIATRL